MTTDEALDAAQRDEERKPARLRQRRHRAKKAKVNQAAVINPEVVGAVMIPEEIGPDIASVFRKQGAEWQQCGHMGWV